MKSHLETSSHPHFMTYRADLCRCKPSRGNGGGGALNGFVPRAVQHRLRRVRATPSNLRQSASLSMKWMYVWRTSERASMIPSCCSCGFASGIRHRRRRTPRSELIMKEANPEDWHLHYTHNREHTVRSRRTCGEHRLTDSIESFPQIVHTHIPSSHAPLKAITSTDMLSMLSFARHASCRGNGKYSSTTPRIST